VRIYISSPINAKTLDGLHLQILAASRAALSVLMAGHTPVIPQMNVLVDELCRDTYGARIHGDVWKRIAEEEIERSDALLFLGLDKRTLGELVFANEIGKTIVTSLSELP